MPSPVGHSLIGLVLFHLFKKPNMKWNILIVVVIIFISNLPDLDFIPGILAGEPNRFHHGISHSFGFLVILAGIIYLLANLWDKTKSKTVTGWFFTFSSLHIILDYFADDTTIPFGEPMFWPVLSSYVISPFPLFFDIRRSNDLDRFFPSLFSLHNMKAIGIEIIFVLIIWILFDRINRNLRKESNLL